MTDHWFESTAQFDRSVLIKEQRTETTGMRSALIAALAFVLAQTNFVPSAWAGRTAAVRDTSTGEAAALGSHSQSAQDTPATSDPSSPPPAGQHNPTAPTPTTNAFDGFCQTLQTAAQANSLPVEFLTRLIWQESRFRPYAISPAGAQGVAQFMPATAAWVGLENPFDASRAINKSAALLRALSVQFGNLGLAAAAYNAGPKRVQDWLAGRGTLPAETQAYVRSVTGRSAADWTPSRASQFVPSAPQAATCPQLIQSLSLEARQLSLPARLPAIAATPKLSWGVQLLGNASQTAVLIAYHQLQIRYRTVLGGLQPFVIRSPVGRSGSWYRVRVASGSLLEAENLCARLRAIGGSCLVQHN